MNVKKTTAAAALTAALALLLTPGSAAADSGGSPPSGDGAEVLCKRVPKIDKRLDRALKRLNGDATKRGSVARLEKRIENAKKLGHDEVATFLNGRLEFRKTLPAEIEKRRKDLASVKTWCEANDFQVGRK